MVEIYKTDNKVLQKLDNIEEGCWVNMIDPTSSELSLVSGYFEIDLADLATALDEEESSRISLEDGYTLILVDIPTPEVRHEKKMYTTIPLGIILKNDALSGPLSISLLINGKYSPFASRSAYPFSVIVNETI